MIISLEIMRETIYEQKERTKTESKVIKENRVCFKNGYFVYVHVFIK